VSKPRPAQDWWNQTKTVGKGTQSIPSARQVVDDALRGKKKSATPVSEEKK
jgi:hypothetical protein